MAHLWYSYHLVWIGNLEAAISEAKRAQELDPLALVTSTSVASHGMAREGLSGAR